MKASTVQKYFKNRLEILVYIVLDGDLV